MIKNAAKHIFSNHKMDLSDGALRALEAKVIFLSKAEVSTVLWKILFEINFPHWIVDVMYVGYERIRNLEALTKNLPRIRLLVLVLWLKQISDSW